MGNCVDSSWHTKKYKIELQYSIPVLTVGMYLVYSIHNKT